jgi:hypothetical protein
MILVHMFNTNITRLWRLRWRKVFIYLFNISDWLLEEKKYYVLSHILLQYVSFCMFNNSYKSVLVICLQGKYGGQIPPYSTSGICAVVWKISLYILCCQSTNKKIFEEFIYNRKCDGLVGCHNNISKPSFKSHNISATNWYWTYWYKCLLYRIQLFFISLSRLLPTNHEYSM